MKISLFKGLKNRTLYLFSSFGEFISLILEVTKSIFFQPPRWGLIRDQFYNIGVTSFSVVAITGISTGIILASQSFYQLSEKGLAAVTGLMVAKAMITELGPVLTALMVTGRVGSAMTAELGTMRVTEQVAALESMSVDPCHYLIAPRFIAGIIMMPLLTIFSIVLGIFGGYLISTLFFGMAPTAYFDPMPDHISVFDISSGIIKSIIFGILLVSVCCYKGIKTTGGAAGVGRSTTSSVVITYIAILITDFLITIALNSIHQEILTDWY
ncbi:MAG: ABC transporter permease [Parachlamydiales bacterium]|nr:ABC transporter permease [Parachlamydiales bacterium]